MAHADAAGVRQAADDCEVQFPLFEDRARRSLAVGAQHHQHALLAFREHKLVGAHAGLTRRHLIQIQFDTDAALARHLDGRTGQAGGAHVLDGDDRVGGHQFQACLDQELLGERIADLHGRPLFLRVGGKLGGRHGRAVDAVAPGLRSDVDHRIADSGRGAEKDAILRRDADGHRVDQRIAIIGRMEVDLAAHRGDADAVAVAADATHHAIHDPLRRRFAG